MTQLAGTILARGYSYLAFALVLFIFILSPWLSERPQGALILQVFFSITLGTAVYACARQRLEMYISLALFVPAFTLLWLGRVGMAHDFEFLRQVTTATFLLYTAGVVLGSTLRTRVISADTISGAVAVYLLIGLGWAFVYGGILALDPTSLHTVGGGSTAGNPLESEELIYFSFVTITTLGYGDISPASQLAQAAATLEAVLGQIYLTVLVARLVGLQIAQSSNP